LRVLLVTDAVGGVWTYSLELARALEALDIEPLLAVMGPSPSAAQRRMAEGLRLIDTGLPLDWMPTSPGELRLAGASLAMIADREQADVVQTCSAALLADNEFSQPCVAVQHSCVATWWASVRGSSLPREFAWRRELTECGLNQASAIIAPTAAFAAQTARTYELCRPVLAVHNGRLPASSRAIPPADFAFTAGRLWDEGKNAATLDAAAARLDIPFEAAGPLQGPNGASASFDHLRTLGEVSEARLAGLLGARPVFASAALYEPFGLTALEAAHAGCALVLSDIPTFRELWGGAACFVPPRDDVAFAETIQLLIDDPEARETMGRAARFRARRYTPEAMASSMARIYSSVTGETRLAGADLEMAGAA
jgi:glycosyltransferase involved in cell wall biosynthesis